MLLPSSLTSPFPAAAPAQREAREYCPLVTPGSYCFVEDTKLSRFSVTDGPAPAVRRFLSDYPEGVSYPSCLITLTRSHPHSSLLYG